MYHQGSGGVAVVVVVVMANVRQFDNCGAR